MSEVLREVRIVRGGVMTSDPPSPGPRIVGCTAVGYNGSEVDLPLTRVEYEHGAQGDGLVKLVLFARHVVFPIEGRDSG